jgi:hypothetical protein
MIIAMKKIGSKLTTYWWSHFNWVKFLLDELRESSFSETELMYCNILY